jgi:hypothetical protein
VVKPTAILIWLNLQHLQHLAAACEEDAAALKRIMPRVA